MSIFIGSIPNSTEKDEILAKEIFKRNKRDFTSQSKISLEKLQKVFESKWDGKRVFLFNRGRDSIYFLLKNLNLNSDDEVVLQAFTCVAVVAPILWSKCKPIFVDVEHNTYNMDLVELRKKISSKSRVVIVQHTFGNLVDMKAVREIIDEENSKRENSDKIFLIEDCAHIFDSQNSELGKYSDAFFFSFAQDKSISSTQGALLIVNNESFFTSDLTSEYRDVDELSRREALYNVRYILLWGSIKKTYFKYIIKSKGITVGKILLLLYRFLRIIKKQASSETTYFDGIHKMSGVQSELILRQLEDVESFNENRIAISKVYDNGLAPELKRKEPSATLLRYPILLKNPNEVRKILSEKGIIVGKWYSTPVFPVEWDKLNSVGYILGECPVAESLCKRVLNLPTNIEVTKEDAKMVVNIVNKNGKKI